MVTSGLYRKNLIIIIHNSSVISRPPFPPIHHRHVCFLPYPCPRLRVEFISRMARFDAKKKKKEKKKKKKKEKEMMRKMTWCLAP